MKIYFIALFAFAPVLCFGVPDATRILYFSGNGTNTAYRQATTINYPSNTLYTIYFNSVLGVVVNSSGVYSPNDSTNNTGISGLLNPQIRDKVFSTKFDRSPFLYPDTNIHQLYWAAYSLWRNGYRGSGFKYLYHDTSRDYLNFYMPDIISDVMSSTNNTYQSIVLSMLNSIHSSLQGINTSINNINVDFGQFQTDYQIVNWDSLNFLDFVDGAVDNGSFTSSHGQYLKDTYNSFVSLGDTSSAAAFKSSVLQQFRNNNLMSDAASWLNNHSNNPSVQSALRSAGDSFGAGAAFHYTTPLTNEMKRMSSDWVNETKSALSNNTQKIKDDLAAWKNQLHGTQTSIDNSAANINNTLNNIANGSSVVRVDLGSVSFGVTLSDPVSIDAAQFNSFSEDLGKAGDYMERLFNEFKWWAWDSPDSWKKGFLDRDLSRLSSNVLEQVSLQHSISNLLADFAFNFTNNTEFAISNALAGFTFSSTNDYLLLSDYADYINTSGLSDLLGVLDDDSYSDLKDELISISADDVSSGYGRWWRYYTGLSTIQANSVFKIANLLIDHEKLLKDLKRENTDVVDLSDSNVFSELLSKIPSQSHIDNKISELTNSIDLSGFARIRELIPDLTNRLSVASALYDHDFALPSDISWVLIPADSDLNIRERVIHISPSEHYRVFQVLHYGIAFSYCIVNLILLPKFLLLLVRLFDRVWNKSEHLIYNSTQS